MADDTYTVVRSAAIAAPPQRVYDQIVDFHRWRAWSPWEDLDPELQRTYTGPDSGVGAAYSWSGNRKAGQGRMEIVEVEAPSLVRIDLSFEKPFKSRTQSGFTIEPDGAGSRVMWRLTGRKTFMVKVMGLFTSMDTMMGKDFEKGLARLRQISETPAA